MTLFFSNTFWTQSTRSRPIRSVYRTQSPPQNRLVQDGVIRQLEIIGEASRHLSDELRAQHPDSPWQQIIGLRNRLIHAYFDINLGIIWDIVQADIPPLKGRVRALLE